MINSHITEYLEYYCGLKVDPQYAVLIRGKWGAGKTWFINQFIERMRTQEKKYLYVSLYGISDFKGIESEFFSQLHPVLSHKGMEMVGKLAKGLIKATIKYDIDNDGRDDGSVDVSLQNMPSYLVNTNDRILIFDDVERCSIPISDLLGYINNFVEHKSYKAILIANEGEIGGGNDNSSLDKYYRIKEKLIGKSFEIEPDFDSAIDVFLKEINNTRAFNAISKNNELIKVVFYQAKYQNFRHLRQSFLEMERIFSIFPVKSFGDKDFIQHFIKFHLIFSLEIRSGNLKPGDIKNLNFRVKYLFDKNSESIDMRSSLEKKYSINFHDALFSLDLWSEILDAGFVNETAISDAITNSKYFVIGTQEEWKILWNHGILDDNKIDRYLKQVREKFDSKEYDDVGVIFHIVGLLLWFSKIGVVKKKSESIIKNAFSYINYLDKINKLPNNISSLFFNNTYQSYGFHEADNPEFQRVINFAKQKSLRVKLKSLPSKALELLDFMKNDPAEFGRILQSSDGIYDLYASPILNFIDKTDFVDGFSSLTNDRRFVILDCLNKRYASSQDKSNLIEERLWLKDLIPVLDRKVTRCSGTLTAHFLLKVRSNLLEILKNWPAD